ncbi:hypothetical protein B0H14DRAFT_2828602, partial [Mycena olivaceomarginata]
VYVGDTQQGVPNEPPPAYTEYSATDAPLPDVGPAYSLSDGTDTSDAKSSKVSAPILLRNIAGEDTLWLKCGGSGGPGGNARIGGVGGDGTGPKLYIDPDQLRNIRNISGEYLLSYSSCCIHLVGKGGAGKGPVIILSPFRPITPASHRGHEDGEGHEFIAGSPKP